MRDAIARVRNDAWDSSGKGGLSEVDAEIFFKKLASPSNILLISIEWNLPRILTKEKGTVRFTNQLFVKIEVWSLDDG